MTQSQQVEITQIHLADGRLMWRFDLHRGPVETQSWKQLTEALNSITPKGSVVLLASAYSSLPQLEPPEEQEWIMAAGEYRKAQEQFRLSGGVLVSLVSDRLVGGTYLIHGMSGIFRFIYPQTLVYPSLDADAYEKAFGHPYPHSTNAETAWDEGLITDIVAPVDFMDRLNEMLT